MRLLHGVLVLTLIASAQAQEGPRTDQELESDQLRDHGYLFELTRPDGWRLLPQADAQQVVPGAVAGLVGQAGMHAVVIVEAAPNLRAPEAARLLIQNMALEAKATERFDAIEFCGQPGVRFSVRGRVGDMTLRYVNTVVSHRGHLYQLLSWGPLQDLDVEGKALASVFEAFRFLPGESPPGRAVTSVQEAHGVGWLVEGGRFVSVPHGLAVARPPPGWRLVLGEDLRQLNENAEVGLHCNSPEIYLVVIPERAAGTNPKEFEALLRRGVESGVGPSQGELQSELGGSPLRLTFHKVDAGMPSDFVHGVTQRGDRAVQVLAWWPTGAREAALAQLPSALKAVSFPPVEELDHVARRLASRDDTQNGIGRTFSLRRRRYQDFELGFRWTSPPKGWWRIQAGQEALAVNPEARLFLEEPQLGLNAILIVEQSEVPVDDGELHLAALQSLLGPGEPDTPPERRTVNGVVFRTSWLDVAQGELSLRYLVATASRGRRLFQLHVWGVPGNIQAAGQRVWEAVDGLQVVPGRLDPTQRKSGALTDQRLGFSFDPPGEGWSLSALSNEPRLEAIGGGYLWQRAGEGLTLVTACSGRSDQDAGWFERFVREGMLARFAQDGIEFSDPVDVVVLGRPASMRQGRERGGGARVDVVTFHRDLTFYALVISDEAGNGITLEQVLPGLKLLD